MWCAACGAENPLRSGERVGFRDTCAQCDADLHACVQCAHHDRGARNECREPASEPVASRERANLCDFFAPAARPADAAGGVGERARARAALDALFKKPGGG